MTTATRTVHLPFRGAVVALTLTEHTPDPSPHAPHAPRAATAPVLVLHGGAGPQSVDAFARRLAEEWRAHVLVPTHPGFAGTPRQAPVTSIRDLGGLYAELLASEDLTSVTVVGSSIGGWAAAELAATAAGADRVARLVLLDAVGLAVDGHPVVDFFSLTFDELAELSYANPAGFRIDPDALPPAARVELAAGRAALLDYAGTSMVDPTLADRLPSVAATTLVVWGAADRIVDQTVGRAYAAAIPDARFVLLPSAGHLPQLESPDLLLRVLTPFAAAAAGEPTTDA